MHKWVEGRVPDLNDPEMGGKGEAPDRVKPEGARQRIQRQDWSEESASREV